MGYFKGDELAKSVWESKYALEGEVTPDDMHKRLAKEFARIDLNYQTPLNKDIYEKLSEYGRTRKELTEESIFDLFKDFKYIIPQGSVMSNLGSDKITSLSNCFVIASPEDSYGSIINRDEELVQLMKRRGGVGIDISTLRPSTAPVTNSAKTSTGAVSFMHRYSNSTREVAQGGRRGALMLSIDINHPDSLEFIKIKRDRESVTGANISIKLNDEFMKAVENDEDYILRFPVDNKIKLEDYEGFKEYDKLYNDPYTSSYFKKIKAKEYWDEIIKSAHGYAEPGLMFWDNMVNYSPDGVYEQYKQICTNPCSEIAMQAYDACRLIAINLYSFVKDPFTDNAKFDYDTFYNYTYEAMRLSDNLIDLELEHIDKILNKIENDPEKDKLVERTLWEKVKMTAKASRRTGLGITALGDTLAALGLKYDSEEALLEIDQIFKMKMKSELNCTIDLSILRGSFEGWDVNKEFDSYLIKGNNIFYQFLTDNFENEVERMGLYGRRNVSWSTVAPTGSVSILTQTTSGIEPLFMPYYTRRKKVNPNDEDARIDFVDELGDSWQEYFVLHPKFKTWFDIKYSDVSSEDLEEFTEEELLSFFEQSPWNSSTANDIDWLKRIEIQSIIQKYTTHSISSTINLPKDVSLEKVSEIYSEGWEKGLKGITVYRDGSRSGVLVNKSNKLPEVNNRPESIPCKVMRFKNEKKNWIAFVGTVNDNPYEIFTGVSDMDVFPIPSYVERGNIIKIKTDDKSRYDFQYVDNYGYTNTLGGLNRIFNKEYWNYARFVSALFREGASASEIINIVSKLEFSNRSLNNWQSGIIRSLKLFVPDGTESKGEKCPDCNAETIIYEDGCKKCTTCGSTACD